MGKFDQYQNTGYSDHQMLEDIISNDICSFSEESFINNLLGMGIRVISRLGRGIVKTGYLVETQNQEILVIRFWEGALPELLFKLRLEGISEAGLNDYLRVLDVKASFLTAEITNAPGQPWDISEFCINLAELIDYLKTFPASERYINELLTARAQNQFCAKNPQEMRDCGLTKRGESIYLVQFDLSSYTKTTLPFTVNEKYFAQKIHTSNLRPINIPSEIIVNFLRWRFGPRLSDSDLNLLCYQWD